MVAAVDKARRMRANICAVSYTVIFNEVRITRGPNFFYHTFDVYRCPRRNVPNFGRVFLRLKYTDITQNTYIQS